MVDKKLTALDAITAVTTDDLIYVVDDPLVTPVSKKITVANFIDTGVMPDGVITIPFGTPPTVPVSGKILLYADYLPDIDTNLIPTMTTATDPSGTASDSEHYANSEAWRAMGGAYNGWLTNGSALPQWIQYQFDSACYIYGYSFRPWYADNYPFRTPRTWKFQGSTDGVNYDDLDTQTGWAPASSATFKLFYCSHNAQYDYYRLYITANQGNAYTGIGGIRMFGPSTDVGLWTMGSNGLAIKIGQ